MNLSGLSKEQKQYIVLGLLVSVAVAVLVVSGVKVSLSSITTARQELEDLSGKIERALQVLKKREQISGEFSATSGELLAHIANAPPDKNYYSWATEIIYSRGREAGLEIEAVDELNIVSRTEEANEKGDKSSKPGDSVQLDAYSLRLNALGSYQSVIAFTQMVEERHPLVRITGVEIATGPGPEKHAVKIYLQWPFNLIAMAGKWEEIAAKQNAVEAKPIDVDQPSNTIAETAKPDIRSGEPEPVRKLPEPQTSVIPSANNAWPTASSMSGADTPAVAAAPVPVAPVMAGLKTVVRPEVHTPDSDVPPDALIRAFVGQKASPVPHESAAVKRNAASTDIADVLKQMQPDIPVSSPQKSGRPPGPKVLDMRAAPNGVKLETILLEHNEPASPNNEDLAKPSGAKSADSVVTGAAGSAMPTEEIGKPDGDLGTPESRQPAAVGAMTGTNDILYDELQAITDSIAK